MSWVGCSHPAKELLRPDNAASDSFAGITVLENCCDWAAHVQVAEGLNNLGALSTA